MDIRGFSRPNYSQLISREIPVLHERILGVKIIKGYLKEKRKDFPKVGRLLATTMKEIMIESELFYLGEVIFFKHASPCTYLTRHDLFTEGAARGE